MTDDPAYLTWVEECVVKCQCCPNCSDVPCDGLLAGGPCDRRECTCDQDPDDEEANA